MKRSSLIEEENNDYFSLEEQNEIIKKNKENKENTKIDFELKNLHHSLSKNLEENTQLQELFLKFFQTKTKLEFLLEEKEYKLILMKFLAFFNEFVIKINSSLKENINLTEPPFSHYDCNHIYNSGIYSNLLSNSPKNIEYLPSQIVSPLPYPEMPYMNSRSNPKIFINERQNSIPNSNVYSPSKIVETIPFSNKMSSPINTKNNIYGDLDCNFRYTKYDPKDHCKFYNYNIINFF